MMVWSLPAAFSANWGTVLIAVLLLATAGQPWFVILATRIVRRGLRRSLFARIVAGTARRLGMAASHPSPGTMTVSDVTFLACAAMVATITVLPDWPSALVGVALALIVLHLVVLDLAHRWLPDRVVLPLLAAGVLAPLVTGGDGWAALVGALAGGGTFFAVQRGYRAWRHVEGLGGGDVKLVAAIGAWCGWEPLPMIVGIAALSALLVVAIRSVLGQTQTQRPYAVPFGAYLAVVFWCVWCLLSAVR
jgi:prepilin signal peptidase PulO-like enzyme (type II secretory pathway)